MNQEIELNSSRISEVLANIKTYSIDDIENLDKPMKVADKLWNLAWDFKDDSEHRKENAVAIIEFVMKNQSDFGLVKILRDKTCPSDVRVDLWYKPSYALASIIIYYCSYDDSFLKEVPARGEAFSKLLKACIGRNFEDHGYEAQTGKLKNLELFAGNRIFKFLEKNFLYCSEFSALIAVEFAKVLQNLDEHGTLLVRGFVLEDRTTEAYRIKRKLKEA